MESVAFRLGADTSATPGGKKIWDFRRPFRARVSLLYMTPRGPIPAF
jgi:hypothetical protein